MTAPPRTVLVVGMIGQVLDAQALRFLDERPLGGQRQLAPVVTCNDKWSQ